MGLEIIVGVDFGTTGVSWAINGGTKKVRLIDDWPKPNSSIENTEKVPTAISYGQDGQPYHWGYSVESTEKSFKWFKLLLDPQRAAQDGVPAISPKGLLGGIDKTPEQVAADYLRFIWRYTTDDIERSQGEGWQSRHALRVVLTVPAIWSHAAKDRTLRAAQAAGLPESLSLVSEPEAAALKVLRDKNEDQAVKNGDCFVVCDAGGGTVDLISYQVVSLVPLQLEECAKGDGDKCGSVYLDLAFERHIRTLVGEEQYSAIHEKRRKRMLQEFEMSVKRCFDGQGQKDYSVDLHGVKDDPENGIEDGTILLRSSLLRTLFDHVMNQILNLVQRQISEVVQAGLGVNAILLVGGFGASKYLHKRLREAYGNFHILQVNGAWSCICTGATQWGLENTLNTAVSGRSGDQIREGHTYSMNLLENVQVGWLDSGTRKFSSELYYCADAVPPPRKEPSVELLCEVEFGVDEAKLWLEKSYKNPLTKEKWRDAAFTLKIVPGSASIVFSVFYQGKQVAYTRAKYANDS
ncbi:MAG: hypothetical protein Q9195_004725 [Heterodermia aff. obscurata]